jgi:protease-4
MKFSKTLSQIYRGKWFIRPDDALSLLQDENIRNLINGKLAGSDSDESLFDRKPLPVMIVGTAGYQAQFMDSFDQAPKGSIAIIGIKGTMMKYGTMCSYGCEEIADQISQAANHKNISSIVLDIDSGGGAVDAVAPLVKSISESGKPVVASADLCCSAAYWTASECDWIVANNSISAEFGSIGVMMSFWDIKGFYEEIGYKFHEIYAPESQNKNEAFRLALEGKYDMIKTEELSPLAQKFQATIKKNREGKLKLDAKGILNGKTFFVEESLDFGLIDEIGSVDTAIVKARELAEKKSRKALIEEYVKQ